MACYSTSAWYVNGLIAVVNAIYHTNQLPFPTTPTYFLNSFRCKLSKTKEGSVTVLVLVIFAKHVRFFRIDSWKRGQMFATQLQFCEKKPITCHADVFFSDVTDDDAMRLKKAKISPQNIRVLSTSRAPVQNCTKERRKSAGLSKIVTLFGNDNKIISVSARTGYRASSWSRPAIAFSQTMLKKTCKSCIVRRDWFSLAGWKRHIWGSDKDTEYLFHDTVKLVLRAWDKAGSVPDISGRLLREWFDACMRRRRQTIAKPLEGERPVACKTCFRPFTSHGSVAHTSSWTDRTWFTWKIWLAFMPIAPRWNMSLFLLVFLWRRADYQLTKKAEPALELG